MTGTTPFIRRAQFNDALGQLKKPETITLPKREEYYAPAFVDLFSNMDAHFIQMGYGKYEAAMLGEFARKTNVPISDVTKVFESITTSTPAPTTRSPDDEMLRKMTEPLRKFAEAAAAEYLRNIGAFLTKRPRIRQKMKPRSRNLRGATRSRRRRWPITLQGP